VNALLETGRAAWCAPIRLELRRGVTNDVERRTLRRYEAVLPDYEITAETWTRAIQLADRGREAGVTAPLADLLIFACARLNGLAIEHDDEHFEALAKLQA
jgi:predicted nucleic acid-binding protein